MFLRFERFIAALLYGSRWIMAPCYLGLIGALVVVLVEFFRELAAAFSRLGDMASADVILAVLKLIDLLLVGNLLLIMSFAGVETFVSKAAANDGRDRPEWMGKVDFSGLKLKVIVSLVAITAVDLLESYVEISTVDKTDLFWQLVILGTFVLTGVLLAWMDKLAETHDHE